MFGPWRDENGLALSRSHQAPASARANGSDVRSTRAAHLGAVANGTWSRTETSAPDPCLVSVQQGREAQIQTPSRRSRTPRTRLGLATAEPIRVHWRRNRGQESGHAMFKRWQSYLSSYLAGPRVTGGSIGAPAGHGGIVSIHVGREARGCARACLYIKREFRHALGPSGMFADESLALMRARRGAPRAHPRRARRPSASILRPAARGRRPCRRAPGARRRRQTKGRGEPWYASMRSSSIRVRWPERVPEFQQAWRGRRPNTVAEGERNHFVSGRHEVE